MAVYEINSIFSKPVLLFYCCFFCYMQYSSVTWRFTTHRRTKEM